MTDTRPNPTSSQAFERLYNRILLTGRLAPFQDGQFGPEYLAEELFDVDVGDIEAALDDMTAAGLLDKQVRPDIELPGIRSKCFYSSTEAGWVAYEDALIARGRRQVCLKNQAAYRLRDLVLGLAMARTVWDRRSKGGFFGGTLTLALWELTLHLREFQQSEIDEAVEDLKRENFVVAGEPRTYKGKAYETIIPTMTGQQAYRREVGNKLGLAEGQSILDGTARNSIRIFWSWQSDHKPSRAHGASAIKHVADIAGRDWAPIMPVEVDTAVNLGEGAVRIDISLFEKIRLADFVVIDVTPVHSAHERLVPNPNVLIELGFAMACKDPDQIFLIQHKRIIDDIPGLEPKGSRLPFDVDHVYRIEYAQPSDLKRRLEVEFRVRMGKRGLIRVRNDGTANRSVEAEPVAPIADKEP